MTAFIQHNEMLSVLISRYSEYYGSLENYKSLFDFVLLLLGCGCVPVVVVIVVMVLKQWRLRLLTNPHKDYYR